MNATMSVSPTQINSMVDLARYQAFIRSLSSRKQDMIQAKAWEQIAQGRRMCDMGSISHAYLQDASESIIGFVGDMSRAPIDTTSPALWIGAWDALVSASKLVSVPDFICREGSSVKEMLTALACTLDVVFRVSDIDARNSWDPPADRKAAYGRFAPLYLDLLCGRGSAWLFLCGVCGVQASKLAGVDWFLAIDAYREHRLNQVAAMIREANGGRGDTIQAYLVQASQFYHWYLQGQEAVDVEGGGLILSDAMRPGFGGIFAEDIYRLIEHGGLIGYCGVFGINAAQCSISAPSAIIDQVVSFTEAVN